MFMKMVLSNLLQPTLTVPHAYKKKVSFFFVCVFSLLLLVFETVFNQLILAGSGFHFCAEHHKHAP